jgi:hypothetical protein
VRLRTSGADSPADCRGRVLLESIVDHRTIATIEEEPAMPSPFPGIDPYLEAQDYWGDFHPSFATYCRDSLNELLPEGYIAQLGEQVRLMELSRREAKRIIPDVAVLRKEGKPVRSGARAKRDGGMLTLEPVTIPLPRMTMEVRDVWIQILRVPKRTPIAVIEILSPTNKVGVGLAEYRLKRRKTIRQKVHLVEFDFLLGGQRLPMDRPLPRGDYYALVARAERRPDCEVYAWTMRDPLPRIPIPLAAPDPDVVLELSAVFATAYERGHYAGWIDYSAPLTLVRNPEDRAWAEQIARRAAKSDQR